MKRHVRIYITHSCIHIFFHSFIYSLLLVSLFSLPLWTEACWRWLGVAEAMHVCLENENVRLIFPQRLEGGREGGGEGGNNVVLLHCIYSFFIQSNSPIVFPAQQIRYEPLLPSSFFIYFFIHFKEDNIEVILLSSPVGYRRVGKI